MGSGRAKNEDCGMTSLEPVERDKKLRISENRISEDKRDPRKHIDTVTKREITPALELRAETTFQLLPLPDHKRKEKRNKYSFKTFSSFPPFS